MTDSESSLVQRAQRGERAAFDELVRRTSRLVFARLHLDTGDVHRAEDLLQETLLTAFKSLGQLTEPDKFRAWLLRIAANVLAQQSDTVIQGAAHDGFAKGIVPVVALEPGDDRALVSCWVSRPLWPSAHAKE